MFIKGVRLLICSLSGTRNYTASHFSNRQRAKQPPSIVLPKKKPNSPGSRTSQPDNTKSRQGLIKNNKFLLVEEKKRRAKLERQRLFQLERKIKHRIWRFVRMFRRRQRQRRWARRMKFFKKYHQKRSLKYVRLLRRFVLWKRRLRTRFIFKYILVTKQALLQYYQKFNLKNFRVIYRLYRKRLPLTRFERFLMFFELRVVNILVRIRYSKYILYSNVLIKNGDIRINGKLLFLYDYQIRLNDLIEISYRGFYRQYFRLFAQRRYWAYRRHLYGGLFYRKPRNKWKGLRIVRIRKNKKRFPRLIPWGILRGYFSVLRSSRLYAAFLFKPRNTFFVQSKNVLATIIFALPRKFRDRKFSKIFTRKHMRFLSNFCVNYIH